MALLPTREAFHFIGILRKTLRVSLELRAPHLPAEKGSQGRDLLMLPGPGLPAPPAAAVQSPDVPKAGHIPLEELEAAGASPRLCNDVWSRWQGWVFLDGLTEPHLPWKFPPVPGNPFQMFSPTALLSRSSGEVKSQRWKAEPAYT